MRSLVFICLIAAIPCSGQYASFYFHQLTTGGGLSSQSENAFLFTDHVGYTWIASLDALNCFDGKTVKVFKANPNDPHSLKGVDIQSPFFEDAAGDIWFSTSEAINCYRRDKGNFDHYYATGDSSGAGGHKAFFLEQKRYLWFAADSSIYRFDTKDARTRFKKPKQILTMFEAARYAVDTDKMGRVQRIYLIRWAYGPGFERIRLAAKDYTVLSRKVFYDGSGRSNGQMPMVFRQGLVDEAGTAWFATNRGLLRFNPDLPEKDSLFSNVSNNLNLGAIATFSDHTLVLINRSKEILLFDTQRAKFSTSPISLYNLDGKSFINQVDYVFPAKGNMLWISGKGSGIYYANVQNRKFKSVLAHNNLQELPVNQILEDRFGAVWCVSKLGSGLTFSPNKLLLTHYKLPLLSNLLKDRSGTLWAASVRGLSTISSTGLVKDVYQPSSEIRFIDIVAYDAERFFIGATNGIHLFNKINKQLHEIVIDTAIVTILFKPSSNQLWSANASGILVQWEITPEDTLKKLKLFPNMGMVNAFFEDKHRRAIWIASSKGLVKISTEGPRASGYELFTEQDGLPNQFVHAILQDNQNGLWLSSNNGLIHFIPENPKSSRFKHYTSRDGLSANEYLPNAALKMPNGEMWFGSINGVDVFHPSTIKNIAQSPGLAIKYIRLHGKEFRNSNSIQGTKPFELDHDENTLTFELAALEYTDPLRNLFKVYLIEDNKSIDSQLLILKNSVTYTNLAPGKYSFRFSGSNAEGVWRDYPDEIRFVINPPIYQTWWFRLLVTAIVVGLVSFGLANYYRYRLRAKQLELEKQQRESDRKQLLLDKELSLQKERNRIAQEMHDELGGGLSTIRIASERAQKKYKLDEVQSILTRVSQISIGLITNMRGLIWAMDTHNDSIENLVAYIRRYAHEFLDDNGLACQISTPEEILSIPVSGHYRHNVLLVVKEALHNVVKHAQATEIIFKIHVNEHLLIDIQDNGIGFDSTEKYGKGVGLRSMQKRMESVGGKIQWKRPLNGGLITSIEAPLDRNDN